MTKEQYNILAAELEKRGYKKYTQPSYLGEDCGYYKYPKKNKFGNSFYQIVFAVYNYGCDDFFSVQVNIIASLILGRKRDLILTHEGQSIDDIERIAASFYEWCENNFNK